MTRVYASTDAINNEEFILSLESIQTQNVLNGHRIERIFGMLYVLCIKSQTNSNAIQANDDRKDW